MRKSGNACTVEMIFTVSPRRLLVAVLAAKPHHFKLVAARAVTMHFTFSSASGSNFHLGEFLIGRIGAAPEGARLEVVGGTVESEIRTRVAMQEFLDRVEFVLTSPGYRELLDKATAITMDDADEAREA